MLENHWGFGPGIGDEVAIDENLLLPSLPLVKLSEDEVETLPVMRILLTYMTTNITNMMHLLCIYANTWQ